MDAQANKIIGTKGVISVAPSTQIIFTIIWCLIAWPWVYAISLGQWEGLWILIASGIAIFGPIYRYRVSWNEDKLVFSGLITTHEIRFTSFSDFKIKSPTLKNSILSRSGLQIFSATMSSPILIINIKPFSHSDITRLIKKLEYEKEKRNTVVVIKKSKGV